MGFANVSEFKILKLLTQPNDGIGLQCANVRNKTKRK